MTTTAITTTTGQGAAAAVYNEHFSREQVELLKRTVAEGTSDDELSLFLEVSRATGLNPFQKQIYAIMRETYNPRTRKKEPKMTIQTGIDGYRLLAARTGDHAGTTDAEYGPLNDQGYPTWARVTVKRFGRNGTIVEFPATARWDEYVQAKDEYSGDEKTGRKIPSGQWPKMPFLMLAKCAEALALRKAFPAELSGVYTSEEMSQADGTATVSAPTVEPPAAQAPATPRSTRTPPKATTTAKQEPATIARQEPAAPEPKVLDQNVAPEIFTTRMARLNEAAATHGLDVKTEIAQLAQDNFFHKSVKRMLPADFERLIDALIPGAGQDKKLREAEAAGVVDGEYEEIPHDAGASV